MTLKAFISCAFVAFAVTTTSVGAAPDAAGLVGAWELQSAKDLKSGQVWGTKENSVWLFTFTRSHWTALQMARERKPPRPESEFATLSTDEKIKASHARVWDEKGQQVFAARGGTWRLDGDKLHHPATVALYSEVLGVDRVFRIVRLDKDTLVVRTEFPDQPQLDSEWTLRRLD